MTAIRAHDSRPAETENNLAETREGPATQNQHDNRAKVAGLRNECSLPSMSGLPKTTKFFGPDAQKPSSGMANG